MLGVSVGQESAMSDERVLLDQLLVNSKKNIFNAIMVTDHDRWSRNNTKSKEGLEELRKNDIGFYVGTDKQDLYNEDTCFKLAIFSEIGELNVKKQTRKSMENRIHRAERGIPTAGRLPYGRTYDKKTGVWGIDQKEADLIKQAAEKYLDGKSLAKFANKHNINYSYLLKVLKNRCGEQWQISIKDKKVKLNVRETLGFNQSSRGDL